MATLKILSMWAIMIPYLLYCDNYLRIHLNKCFKNSPLFRVKYHLRDKKSRSSNIIMLLMFVDCRLYCTMRKNAERAGVGEKNWLWHSLNVNHTRRQRKKQDQHICREHKLPWRTERSEQTINNDIKRCSCKKPYVCFYQTKRICRVTTSRPICSKKKMLYFIQEQKK